MIPQSHRKILNYRFVSASADTKRTPPSPAGVYPTEGRVSDRVPYAVRKAYKVERILTNHPYNDLGLLARKKLIVLAEAESDWSIIYRLAGYYFDSMEQFATQMGMNPHQKAKIDLLDVEAFVIYPGKEPCFVLEPVGR